MKPTNQTDWICTRPKLASQLMAAGFQLNPVKNPWHTEMLAWSTACTPELIEYVRNYYAEMGKPMPKALIAYAGTESRQ